MLPQFYGSFGPEGFGIPAPNLSFTLAINASHFGWRKLFPERLILGHNQIQEGARRVF